MSTVVLMCGTLEARTWRSGSATVMGYAQNEAEREDEPELARLCHPCACVVADLSHRRFYAEGEQAHTHDQHDGAEQESQHQVRRDRHEAQAQKCDYERDGDDGCDGFVQLFT